MSKKFLSPEELYQMGQRAEFGELDYFNVSKRHLRILAALHYVVYEGNGVYRTYYANLQAIEDLIEKLFGKRMHDLPYWIEDLIKRGYVVLYNVQQNLTENFFSLSDNGIDFFISLYQDDIVEVETNPLPNPGSTN
jgi:hypothetical protein